MHTCSVLYIQLDPTISTVAIKQDCNDNSSSLESVAELTKAHSMFRGILALCKNQEPTVMVIRTAIHGIKQGIRVRIEGQSFSI